MSKLISREQGWAIVTAMMVMSTALIIGLAAIAFADTESHSSQRERQHEARLNLTEGALASELYRLSHDWPTQAPGFEDCTQNSDPSTSPNCFTAAQLKANYSQVDLSLSTSWLLQVRDDVGAAPPIPGVCDPSASGMGGYYDDSLLSGPNYDANQNCQLWVRAEGVLDGKKRVVVAKVRVDTRPVQYPIAPFVAGSFNTGNNAGSKVIVDGSGQSGQVRCDATTDPACTDYNGQQVSNPGTVTSDPTLPDSVLDPAMVDAMRKTARANKTYYSTTTPGYTSCPVDPSGAVVFIEDLSCAYGAGPVVNGTKKNGMFVINKGTLTLSGNREWWGAIHLLNAQGCGASTAGPCINSKGYKDVVAEVTGTVTVYGGIFIDGNGRPSIGNSGDAGNGNLPQLVYTPEAFPPLQVYGTAGIIQNTWRELTAG